MSDTTKVWVVTETQGDGYGHNTFSVIGVVTSEEAARAACENCYWHRDFEEMPIVHQLPPGDKDGSKVY